MRKKTKLIQGFGVNDVDYKVTDHAIVGGKEKIIWTCPYYIDWSSIINRCVNLKHQEKQPTYKDCTIDPDWKYLSNYIKFVDSQPNRDWVNCVPDKDLLFIGNKNYAPDTVVYLPRVVNNFTTDRCNDRGAFMLGVSRIPSKKKPYQANCSNPFTRKCEYLGTFTVELEAHLTWQAKKHEHACLLAEQQRDPRVAKALRERYAPDKDWTNR